MTDQIDPSKYPPLDQGRVYDLPHKGATSSATRRAAGRALDVLEGLASGSPQESGQILAAVKTLRLHFGLIGPEG